MKNRFMRKLFYFLLLPAVFMACSCNNQNPKSMVPSNSEMQELTLASEPLAELLQPKQLDFAFNLDGVAYSMNTPLLKNTILPNAYYDVHEDVTVIWLRGFVTNNPGEELFFEMVIKGKVTETSQKALKVTLQIGRVVDELHSESVFTATATDMPIQLSNISEHALTNEINAYALELSFEGQLKKTGGGTALVSGGKLGLVY